MPGKFYTVGILKFIFILINLKTKLNILNSSSCLVQGRKVKFKLHSYSLNLNNVNCIQPKTILLRTNLELNLKTKQIKLWFWIYRFEIKKPYFLILLTLEYCRIIMENLYFVLKELKVNTAFAVQGFPNFWNNYLHCFFLQLSFSVYKSYKKINLGFWIWLFIAKEKKWFQSNQTWHSKKNLK